MTSMKNAILERSPLLANLPQALIVNAPDEVECYLKQHPDLSAFLPAICQSVRVEFAEPAEVSLEVYHDPEIEDHHLNLVVRLPSYDSSTMRRIDSIWEKYEEEITGTSGWLSITTDFRICRVKNGL
jgi:hypothetical protein